MTRQWLRYATMAALIVLPACRDPFKTYEDEYGRVADPKTLHTARLLPLADKAGEPHQRMKEPPTERDDMFEGVEELSLSIEQCRAWTLQNNLDLRVALIAPDIAETFVGEEDARFEAVFRAQASVSDADPGQAEVFRDQFVRPVDINPGIDFPMRTGGTFRLATPYSRRETFSSFRDDDRYASDIDFSISQPLLRNAGRFRVPRTHLACLAAISRNTSSTVTNASTTTGSKCSPPPSTMIALACSCGMASL
jgi:hypothetical protein